MKPEIVQIGSTYVNLSQIAYAKMQAATAPSLNQFSPSDPNFSPYTDKRPQPHNARLVVVFSGGAQQEFFREEAILLEQKLSAFLVP